MFTFIVGIQFWHIRFSGTFPFLPYSHTLLFFLSLPLTPLALSLSLSLIVSLFLSPTHSPIYISLSYSINLSISHSPFSLSFSLSASFPPFLSFHLRLFNLFNDHSPSSLSPPDYNRCTNLLYFVCTERTVK